MNDNGHPEGSMKLRTLAAGTIACIVLAFVVAVLLPITDRANRADAKGKPREYSQLALTGRTLYIREGCFSCHSQSVRNTLSDSLLGPRPSEAGTYANEAPNLIGTIRLGPDLTCVGSRGEDAAWHVRHLKTPQAVRPDSTMPRYGYLSNNELQALAAYLLSLTCEVG
jgi:cbb3-type cytochrome c oxidase subunit II